MGGSGEDAAMMTAPARTGRSGLGINDGHAAAGPRDKASVADQVAAEKDCFARDGKTNSPAASQGRSGATPMCGGLALTCRPG